MIDPLSSLSERRQRFRIAWAGTVWAQDSDGHVLVGDLQNVSVGGVSFSSDCAPQDGAVLKIYVQLLPEGTHPLSVDAKVVHTAFRADHRFDVRCCIALPLQ